MQEKYPLEYIDLLATMTLNPSNVELNNLTQEQLDKIKVYLEEETYRIQSSIKNHVFTVNKKKEVELLVRQYYSSIINIIDIVVGNREKLPKDNVHLKEVYQNMLTVLNELLLFIENRFAKFLSLEEKVASTYLVMTKQRLTQKLTVLRKQLGPKNLKNNATYQLLLTRLNRFTERAGSDFEVTFRTLFYKRELIKLLEEIDAESLHDANESVFGRMDRLLIYLNYNSKTYIDELTLRIFKNISTLKNALQKLDRLRYYRKEFKQLHRKPGYVLNPNYHDLDIILENWFDEEILYFEKIVQVSPPTASSNNGVVQEQIEKKNSEASKILCNLTTDQIALILRGADESRLFISKSMNEVFKRIVPHLSTPYKTDLSYDAMRSKSYIAEERDKERAIEALEKIIRKVRDY